jgi:hypothetical protein
VIENILGITSLLIVAGFTLLIAIRWPSIATVLFVAFLVRAGAVLFHFYVAPLPDSGNDAVALERIAWEWAQGGVRLWWDNFTGPSSYFLSWILAFFYIVTDRSLLMAQAVSLWFGMGTVMLGWLLARELWNEKAAKKAAWVLALFPTLVLYSALTMREAYVWFFMLVALLGVVRWGKKGHFLSVLLAFAGFVGATFFHGAMIVGAFAFTLLLLLRSSWRVLVSLSRARIRLLSSFLVFVMFAFGAWYLAGGLEIPKIGTWQQAVEVERQLTRIDKGTGDTAAYPSWTVPQNASEVFWKTPIRVAYFLFAPFPWDVRSARHLIGVVDGLLYVGLVFLLWKNRRHLWFDPGGRLMLLVLVAMILIFSIAIGNFGTGIRHRAKFVAALIVMAAPALPRLVLYSKKSKENITQSPSHRLVEQ